MLVPAFYSPLRGIGLECAWHDNDERPIGQRIASTDHVSITRHVKRCRSCILPDRYAGPKSTGQAKHERVLAVEQ